MQHLTLDIMTHIGISLSVLMGAMSVAAIAGHTGQTGLLYTTEKLMPKADKISPIAGFKRIFGKEALVQFIKTLFKVIVLVIVAYKIIMPHFHEAEKLVYMEPIAWGAYLFDVLKELLIKLLIVMGIFSGADFFYSTL